MMEQPNQLAKIFKALGDENRLRILLLKRRHNVKLILNPQYKLYEKDGKSFCLDTVRV